MKPRADGAWVEVPFEVQSPQGGLRADAYLTERLRGYSRSEVQRLMAEGRVSVAGRLIKPSHRVSPGEIVLIRYPRREEPPARHAALPVLYEDERLLAVDKPGDVLSHPTDRVTANTVTSILRAQFPRASLHLIHRLDRETSGVLLLAKSPSAARALTEQFTSRRVQKEYLALVAGRVGFDRRIVDEPIGREGAAIKVRQAVTPGQGARCRTEFSRLAAAREASMVLAIPKTGRLHQIRVHLAWLGHPVLGDKLYTGGGEAYMRAVRRELTPEDALALGASRQMLHAWRLRVFHPETGASLILTAPPPKDFLDCVERWFLPLRAVLSGADPLPSGAVGSEGVGVFDEAGVERMPGDGRAVAEDDE